jgi:ATP-dependent DNA helicase RecQ
VLEISGTGVAVMKAEQPPPAMLADLVPTWRGSRANGTNPRALGTNPRATRAARFVADEDAELDPEAQARFERLRRVRTELAKEKQLPPYVICHDRTLAAIARAAPGDLASLEDIKGMGPFKVKMYGEQFLAAMQDPT